MQRFWLNKISLENSKDGLEFVTEDLVIEKCSLYDYGKSLTKEEIKILIDANMKDSYDFWKTKYLWHKSRKKKLLFIY